jgi:aldose 1-epimerase
MKSVVAGCAGILALLLSVPGAARAADKPAAAVQKAPFGKTPDGKPIEQITLRNAHGMVAKIITYGATLTELWVPDKDGKSGDVVLGFDKLDGYLGDEPFFGATVGRYANRIAKGKFTLDGKEYSLPINNGPNSLHGGKVGFNRRIWKYVPVKGAKGPEAAFEYVSPDGEEGYPGTVRVRVVYALTNENELKLSYNASVPKSSKATIINITNHSYFNLAGAGNGNILKETLWIDADKYTPTDKTLIPTGELKPVAGTPFDFTKPEEIGSRISQIDIGGYDINYVLNGEAGKLRKVAALKDTTSGREMDVETTEPGVQVYISLGLDGKIHGIGGSYEKFGAICLETQHFPDSPNQPSFPSTVLRPGQTYKSQTIYKFSAH